MDKIGNIFRRFLILVPRQKIVLSFYRIKLLELSFLESSNPDFNLCNTTLLQNGGKLYTQVLIAVRPQNEMV